MTQDHESALQPEREYASERELLAVSAAAALKGVSREAVYGAVRAGRLPHVRILGHIGLSKEDVLAWQPLGHKAGRPRGTPMSEEAKRKLSATQKQRWAQRKREDAGQRPRKPSRQPEEKAASAEQGG